MSLPADFTARMVEMIRGAAPADDAWFAGGPILSPAEQLEVYREQYRLRMWDALWEEIPGVRHLLGDGLDDVVWGYLADCPPRTWTLGDIADRLADWLAARGAPEAHVDMARLDRAVMKGFVAADGVTPTAEALATMPPLRLQPHVTLLRLRANVHEVRSAVVSGAPPPALAAGDFPVVIFRRDLRMRHAEVEPGAFAVLEALSGGATVDRAVEAALAVVGDVPALVAKLPVWFRFFGERGLVELAHREK